MSASPAVDRAQLRALVGAYLKLSLRTAVLFRTRGKPSSFAAVVGMYGLGGILAGLSALAHPNVFVFSMGVHSVTFFAATMAAIIDANEVLFDHRQQQILSALPVGAGTVLFANALTLFAFTSIPVLALNLAPSFLGLAAAGALPWFPLVHLLSVVLDTVFVCAAVVCTYGVVLRLYGRDRFEGLAVWAQVGMVMFYVGGFQILPRLFQGRNRAQIAEAARWLLPTPPGWFAALDAWCAGTSPGPELMAGAGVALLAPAVLAAVGLPRLSTAYAESAAPRPLFASSAKVTAVKATPWRSKNPLLRWWLSDPIEWAAFRLVTTYMRRDREIKVRVYTHAASFVIFAVLAFLQPRTGPPFVSLALLAFSSAAAMGSVAGLHSSAHFGAAQMFFSAPLASAASVFYGVRKACILFIQGPLLLGGLILPVVLRPDWQECLKLALPMIIPAGTITLFLGATESYLPLSRPPQIGGQSSRRSTLMLGVLLFLFASSALGYAALAFGWFWVLLAVEAIATAVIHVWLRRKIAAQPLHPAEEA
jgi:hypothetical protein